MSARLELVESDRWRIIGALRNLALANDADRRLPGTHHMNAEELASWRAGLARHAEQLLQLADRLEAAERIEVTP